MKHGNLGKFIKQKRLKELPEVSLNKFAIDNDIDSATLSRIENLKQDIKFRTLQNVANGFGMKASELIKEFEMTED